MNYIHIILISSPKSRSAKGGNVGERRNIPIHAEKTVSHDERGFDGGPAGEQSF